MRRRVDGIEAVGLAYLAAMVAVGTALAWPVYATPRLWLVAGVGTLVGGGLVVLGRARGWSGTTTALTVLAAYLLVVGPVAVPSSTRSVGGLVAGVGSGLTGAVLGWKQLLTLSLPAEQYQAVLAPFLAAVVVATASAAGLSLRRGAGVSWAVLPLLALALVGPAFGPVQPEPTAQVGPWLLPDARTVVLALAAVGLSVVWLGLRDRMVRARALRLASVTTAGGGGPRRSLARGVVRAGLAAVVVVVAAAVGVAASAGAAGVSERRVLREEVEPVLAVQRESAPLDAYRAFFADDALDAALFEVSVTGEDAPDRLVVAVLDSYDGVRFTVSAGSGTFARLPRVTGREGTEVEVTIRDWSAVWVPVPEDLERAPVFGGARADQLAASFFVSGSTGAAVQVATDDSGAVGLRAGDTYRVWVTPAGPARLGAPGDAPRMAEELPELAAWVAEQAQPRTAEGYLALVELLRSRGYLSHGLDGGEAWVAALAARGGYRFEPSYAGHSRARVEELFAALSTQAAATGQDADEAQLVAGVGDDEQFATAAALLARYVGYESRVVLGVRLTGDEVAVPACTDVCTGQNLAAWVQVRSPGGDWVDVDSSPQTAVPPTPTDPGQQLPQNATGVEAPQAPSIDPPEAALQGDTTVDPGSDEPADEPVATWAVVLRDVGLGASALGLVVVPFSVVPVAKVVRRRRRRAADSPEVAVVGAWHEVSDRLLDHGLALSGATRSSAASGAGRPGLAMLAELTDRAVFAGEPPTRQDAGHAWSLVDSELGEVVGQLSPWRRLRAAVTPRSLVHAGRRAGGVREGRGYEDTWTTS